MKKSIHGLLKKMGFRIINRNKMFKNRLKYLSKYPVNENIQVFLESFEHIIKLEKSIPGISFKDDKNGICVSFNDINIVVETAEEFFIIGEIFVDYDYKFLLKSDVIVLDIGMNIGVASLFFSQMENVRKIYSFEPVLDTFNNAVENFERNPVLKNKIIPHNFGLGKESGIVEFLYDKKIKGNTGVRGIKSVSYKNSDSTDKRKAQIEDIEKVFIEIIKNNSETNFVFKIDCEGAEYHILEKLNSSNLISSAKVYIIEWHDEGSEVLEKILLDNDFIVFSRKLAINSGMLYAYNSKL